jgi:hypothetical protein
MVLSHSPLPFHFEVCLPLGDVFGLALPHFSSSSSSWCCLWSSPSTPSFSSLLFSLANVFRLESTVDALAPPFQVRFPFSDVFSMAPLLALLKFHYSFHDISNLCFTTQPILLNVSSFIEGCCSFAIM